jgi:tetratricopeptide (TPR) repeat protein
MSYTNLGMVHFYSGDLKSAQRYTEVALELAQEGKSKSEEGFSRIWLGAILGMADASQSAEAEEHILQGIRLLDELGLRPMCSMGHLSLGQHYAGTGHREKALRTLKKAEAAFQEMGMDLNASMARAALENLQG